MPINNLNDWIYLEEAITKYNYTSDGIIKLTLDLALQLVDKHEIITLKKRKLVKQNINFRERLNTLLEFKLLNSSKIRKERLIKNISFSLFLSLIQSQNIIIAPIR